MEGDAQPCLHDIGIKPGDTCAAAGFNLFFQQFQVILRNRLKQADLVTEIPFGQEEIFLSSPPKSSVALDGPTFVDDDTVMLCSALTITAHRQNMRSHTKQRRWCRGVAKEGHRSLHTKLSYNKMVLSL